MAVLSGRNRSSWNRPTIYRLRSPWKSAEKFSILMRRDFKVSLLCAAAEFERLGFRCSIGSLSEIPSSDKQRRFACCQGAILKFTFESHRARLPHFQQ